LQVDIWSIGCILYTMLVGKPPFETRDIKTTYSKIKRNDYRIPSSANISPDGQDLIRMLLHRDPAQRPKVDDILVHPFLAGAAYVPSELPVKALHVAPDFSAIPAAARPEATYRTNGAATAPAVIVASKTGKDGVVRTPFSPLNGNARVSLLSLCVSRVLHMYTTVVVHAALYVCSLLSSSQLFTSTLPAPSLLSAQRWLLRKTRLAPRLQQLLSTRPTNGSVPWASGCSASLPSKPRS
jgi:serine/threonine protein kinase